METFDKWLLDRFQAFSDFSQLTIKKNCYWWATVGVNISAVWILLIIYDALSQEELELILQILFVVVGLIILGTNLYELNVLKEASKEDKPNQEVSNLVSRSRATHILIGIAGVIMLDLYFSIGLAFGATAYFMSCNPIPPGPTKPPQPA